MYVLFASTYFSVRHNSDVAAQCYLCDAMVAVAKRYEFSS